MPEDAPRMLELNGEESTRRWLPSHVYADLAAADAAIARLIALYSRPGTPKLGGFVLAVALRDTGELLGHVGFSPLRGEVEVSYAIAEHARGRGFGSEALEHACRWAAGTFDLEALIAITACANEASRRTLARAGFVHAADEVMDFQGTGTLVSRYTWLAGRARSG